MLIVDKNHRRKGIGQAISTEALAVAIEELEKREISPTEVRRYTAEWNIPAQRLLESLGYETMENYDGSDMVRYRLKPQALSTSQKPSQS